MPHKKILLATRPLVPPWDEASKNFAYFLAKHIPAAIVNAGDGINEHPTQALLDAYSMQEKLGKLEGLKVAIIGHQRSVEKVAVLKSLTALLK